MRRSISNASMRVPNASDQTNFTGNRVFGELGTNARFILRSARFQIIGVPDIKCATGTMEHVSPE
jgi:hypothetical protein